MARAAELEARVAALEQGGQAAEKEPAPEAAAAEVGAAAAFADCSTEKAKVTELETALTAATKIQTASEAAAATQTKEQEELLAKTAADKVQSIQTCENKVAALTAAQANASFEIAELRADLLNATTMLNEQDSSLKGCDLDKKELESSLQGKAKEGEVAHARNAELESELAKSNEEAKKKSETQLESEAVLREARDAQVASQSKVTQLEAQLTEERIGRVGDSTEANTRITVLESKVQEGARCRDRTQLAEERLQKLQACEAKCECSGASAPSASQEEPAVATKLAEERLNLLKASEAKVASCEAQLAEGKDSAKDACPAADMAEAGAKLEQSRVQLQRSEAMSAELRSEVEKVSAALAKVDGSRSPAHFSVSNALSSAGALLGEMNKLRNSATLEAYSVLARSYLDQSLEMVLARSKPIRELVSAWVQAKLPSILLRAEAAAFAVFSAGYPGSLAVLFTAVLLVVLVSLRFIRRIVRLLYAVLRLASRCLCCCFCFRCLFRRSGKRDTQHTGGRQANGAQAGKQAEHFFMGDDDEPPGGARGPLGTDDTGPFCGPRPGLPPAASVPPLPLGPRRLPAASAASPFGQTPLMQGVGGGSESIPVERIEGRLERIEQKLGLLADLSAKLDMVAAARASVAGPPATPASVLDASPAGAFSVATLGAAMRPPSPRPLGMTAAPVASAAPAAPTAGAPANRALLPQPMPTRPQAPGVPETTPRGAGAQDLVLAPSPSAPPTRDSTFVRGAAAPVEVPGPVGGPVSSPLNSPQVAPLTAWMEAPRPPNPRMPRQPPRPPSGAGSPFAIGHSPTPRAAAAPAAGGGCGAAPLAPASVSVPHPGPIPGFGSPRGASSPERFGV